MNGYAFGSRINTDKGVTTEKTNMEDSPIAGKVYVQEAKHYQSDDNKLDFFQFLVDERKKDKSIGQ